MTLKIPVEKLHRFTIDVFASLGVPRDEAKMCADVLLESDLRGIESHGIGRLKMYFDRIRAGIQSPTTKRDIISDRDGTVVIDGNHGMGHVIGVNAMNMAIDKARRFGLGAVAVRNSTHYGIAGYYSLMAIRQNMAGFAFTNARPSIPPTFGVEPLLGTNPVTFGCPTDEPFPFLIDCATSITQRGKIEMLEREGKPTPEGWAIDSEGRPHTDTTALLKDLVKGTAALLPIGGAGEILGGHKGYGWSTMVEIFSAAFQDGSHTRDLLGFKDGKPVPYKLGHFFLAIDIAHFVEIETFKMVAGSICRTLRNSNRAAGESRIWTAGEKEFEYEQRVRAEGVPVTDALLKDIRTMQSELRLDYGF